MIVLAVICFVVVAAVVLVMAAVGFSHPITFSSRFGDLITQPFWLFLLGVLVGVLLLLGLSLLRRGTRHRMAQRRELRRLRKVEESTTGPVPTSRPEPRAADGGPVGDAAADRSAGPAPVDRPDTGAANRGAGPPPRDRADDVHRTGGQAPGDAPTRPADRG